MFYIDPGGSNFNPGTIDRPWKDWGDYEARLGPAELAALHRVTLLDSIDRIVTPSISAAGHLQIVGAPTPLYTGAFGAGTAGPNRGAQVATNLTDAALPNDPTYASWTDLMGANDFVAVRVRITSGDRADSVGWVVADLGLSGGKAVARSSRFSNLAGSPQDNLDISGPGPNDPVPGDPFVVETLPSINDLTIDPRISGDGRLRTAKLSFWGVRIPLLFTTFPTNVLYVTQFLGCDIIGPANVNAFGTRLDSMEVTVGCTIIARQCAITSFFYTDAGSSALLLDTIAQGTSLIPDAGSALSLGDVGVFDAFGPAIWPAHGAAVTASDLVWGTGSSTYGWQIDGYGQLCRYFVQPTVTGNVGNVGLNGVTKSYAALPTGIYDATKGSGLVPAA
jgi:hypothetical protein